MAGKRPTLRLFRRPADGESLDYKRDEVGALWDREGKKGTYYTGYIEIGGERISLLVYTNQPKASSSQRDEEPAIVDDDDIPF